MAATTATSFSTAVSSLSSPTINPSRPINSLLFRYSIKPNSASKPNPSLTFPRLRITHATAVAPKRVYRSLAVSVLVNGNSETHPEGESGDSNAGATIDIKLPRRSLLVQFTCDVCGERTERLINRLAYERGLVYVQCAGCLQHHKLVDNLGIMVEYDLREISVESSMDEV